MGDIEKALQDLDKAIKSSDTIAKVTVTFTFVKPKPSKAEPKPKG